MPHSPSFQRWRRRIVAGSAAALLAATCGVGCSSRSVEPLGRAGQDIAGGTVDESHQNVFLLGWHQGQTGALCTATLIAPNLLLTARHCVSPNSGEDEHVLCGDASLGEPYPPDAFFATNAARPREGSPFFHVSEVRVPASTVDTCGYDIALLILDQNVPNELSAPAVPRIDRDAVPGERYTAVGYGVDQSGEPSGSRMQLAGLSVDCEPGTCGEGVESTEFLGETGICSGDSGGPALDAEGKVLGVVSRGGPDCSTPVYGSVSAWRDFIVQTAADAATLGDYEPAFWVTSGSSDPPVVSGAAGAGAGGGAPQLGAEGDQCAAPSDCGEGLVCYLESAASEARCTATCRDASDCADGMICKAAGSTSVCTAPSGSGDDSSGCGVAAPRSPRFSGATFAILALALGALRRLVLGPRLLARRVRRQP